MPLVRCALLLVPLLTAAVARAETQAPAVDPDYIAPPASLAPERVMGTIAEALVATAVGLVVAIPAVAIFNYFQGRVSAALADAETLGHVLLAHLRGLPDAAVDSERVAAE